MSGGNRTTYAREAVPEIGRWVHTATLHIVFLIVAAGLCFLVLPSPLWIAIGVSLAVAGTLLPNVVPTWWLLLVLGLSQVWRELSATDVVFYLLLAGVHLLHVLGSLVRLLPWDGRMQLVSFVRPLKRFVLIQAAVQVVAVGALVSFGNGPGTVQGLSILAAVVLGLVAAVLARGLRQAKAPAEHLLSDQRRPSAACGGHHDGS